MNLPLFSQAEQTLLNPDTPEDWQALADVLQKNPDYKVLRRLSPAAWLERPAAPKTHSSNTLRGVVLDTETTGMNSLSDKVIELGMILFEYDPVLQTVVSASQVFNEMEDPGFPIPAESTQIHHITDEMVRGKFIDDQAVHRLLEGVSLVIAHNAGFDRPFVENRWPIFASLPWGCSLHDVNWKANGVGSAKLEYLCMLQGFFYEAHRAVTDCWALLEVMNMRLPMQEQTVAQTLFDSRNTTEHQVFALGSPFETKDLLKSRGYRWNGELKCWSRIVSQEALSTELSWLKDHVYGHKREAKVEIETFSRLEKYSDRPGLKRLQSLSS
jgi:DNA polymerase III subunit epsilon